MDLARQRLGYNLKNHKESPRDADVKSVRLCRTWTIPDSSLDISDLSFHPPSMGQLSEEPSENSFPVSKIILELEENLASNLSGRLDACLLKIGDRSFTSYGS